MTEPKRMTADSIDEWTDDTCDAFIASKHPALETLRGLAGAIKRRNTIIRDERAHSTALESTNLEAANLLAETSRRVGEVEARCEELRKRHLELDRLRVQNARLIEALRPFANSELQFIGQDDCDNAARVLQEEGDAISDHDRQLAARVLRWAAYGQTTGSALYPRQMAEAAERLERGDRELEKELGIE